MKSLIRIALALALICVTVNAECQIKLDLKKKIENKVNQRANQKADQAIDKGMDKVEGGVKGDVKKTDQAGQPAATQNKSEGKPAEAGDQGSGQKPSGQEQPSLETYSKYDFVPGEKVIFYEDFSQDAVGDFPASWNTNGSAEVVTTNLFPGHWLRYIGDDCVWTDGLLKLPENYTIEFDIVPIKGEEGEGMAGYSFRLLQCINQKSFDPGAIPGKAGFLFNVEYYGRPNYRSYINGDEGEGLALDGSKDGDDYKEKINQKYHIALWMQKSRVRLYQDQNKLFDLPKAFPVASVKMDRLRFEEGALMVSNIRIAVGAPDMRNKLLTEGKLVSYGIYFDVNKDVVKPESYGTLKEIASILTENPDVKVKIVGHTDSDGADAANLDLSKRRGASVKNELVKTFGIDASRLESDGMGETQPVAPNDTPANKALNRRVEFIKL
ncbi:MAG: OmpA family protein [Bacteroidota bacterium]|nr:OmpA family protein [Bacteroidota bacterium]